MEPQNFEKKREEVKKRFAAGLRKDGSLAKESLKLSWSNWGFGIEPLEATAKRLQANGIEWIELHGNRYGPDLGYRGKETKELLAAHGIRVAGICGMFGPENDLSSNSGIKRQNAIDYIRRQIELCVETGGSYMLVVPGAVGRPDAYDDSEFHRSVETLQRVADDFVKAGVRAAVEPIRSAEVSLIHTFAEAEEYIAAVDSEGVKHINGDLYHMQVEESNTAETIADSGERMINLHMADSNRCALGDGSLDFDAVIMALYAVDYTKGLRFVTPEPLGPGGDPYPAMHGKPDPAFLDKLVADSAAYFRAREAAVKSSVQ